MTDPRSAPFFPIAAALALCAGPAVAQLTITRASISTTGVEGDADSPMRSAGNCLALSADGRFAAFVSPAAGLVPGDTNGVDDVFVHELATGVTERVSVSTAGRQMLADRYGRGCFCVAISGDGRYVTFSTAGSKLIDGEKGGGSRGDVYLRDRAAGTTQRVSLSSSGGTPNGDSWYTSLTPDGRYVAFYSSASNLVASDRNRTTDIFVRDLWTRTNVRASVDVAGGEANSSSLVTTNRALSDDGRRVVFVSTATDLVAGDTNGVFDVFVRDLVAGTTERVNVSPSGAQLQTGVGLGSIGISGNGRFVTYVADDAALMPAGAPRIDPSDPNSRYYYQAFQYDCVARTTTCVSRGPSGDVADAGVGVGGLGSSHDGRYLAFTSRATNLVAGFPGDMVGVFVRDTLTGGVAFASQGLGGASPDGSAFPWQVVLAEGGAGLTVGFASSASNLVTGDGNGRRDVFVAR